MTLLIVVKFGQQSQLSAGLPSRDITACFHSLESPRLAVFLPLPPESTYSSLLLCFCKPPLLDPERILERIDKDLRDAAREVECACYESLQITSLDRTAHHDGDIFVINSMTPSPDSEADFNDWYAYEHIPLLSRVPHWVASERFILVSSLSDKTPRYLALHKWGNRTAFSTDEYQMATDTAWRTRVMQSILNKERIVLQYKAELINDGWNVSG